MVKKRNRRTRKKYKKRGGVSNDKLRECNDRLKSQGIGILKEEICIESNGKAGLKNSTGTTSSRSRSSTS